MLQACLEDKPLHIVWPHRWEHDKNPEAFFDTLFKLHDESENFHVSILGENFNEIPEIFNSAHKVFYLEITNRQGMSCEGACAHAHVRCAVARVRAKSFLKSVRDVRACGSFLGVRCATIFFHTFGTKLP